MILPDYILNYDIPLPVAKKHYDSLVRHISAVQLAGQFMGLPKEQMDAHDQSKFEESEFVPYAMNFHSGEDWSLMFKRAWLHHIHNNPHHPEHWVYFDRSVRSESSPPVTALPMPDIYVKEMIADWHGASKEYQGHWDISEWINKHGPTYSFHESTHERIDKAMHDIGYFITDNCPWSYMRGDKFFMREIES